MIPVTYQITTDSTPHRERSGERRLLDALLRSSIPELFGPMEIRVHCERRRGTGPKRSKHPTTEPELQLIEPADCTNARKTLLETCHDRRILDLVDRAERTREQVYRQVRRDFSAMPMDQFVRRYRLHRRKWTRVGMHSVRRCLALQGRHLTSQTHHLLTALRREEAAA